MYTLDKAIQENKEDLKQIITEYAKELNNKDFKLIYSKIHDEWLIAAFTALLLKNNINPLEYMDYVPYAFAYDLQIEFKIPDNISKIESQAFAFCDNLKSIYIPKSVKIIEDNAFYGCNKLKDIFYEGSEEDWKNIEVGWGNILFNANIHYNS